MTPPSSYRQRRHKCFDDTHQEMIETAVLLISEKGVEALSIAAVARAMGINRTTVYYHFDSRESLIAAVKAWSAEQLAQAFKTDASQQQRIDCITLFVLENPELIKKPDCSTREIFAESGTASIYVRSFRLMDGRFGGARLACAG